MQLHLTFNPVSIKTVIATPSRRIIPSSLAPFFHKRSTLKTNTMFYIIIEFLSSLIILLQVPNHPLCYNKNQLIKNKAPNLSNTAHGPVLLNVHINDIEVGAYQSVTIPEDLKMDRKSHNEKIKTIMFHSRHSNGIRA